MLGLLCQVWFVDLANCCRYWFSYATRARVSHMVVMIAYSDESWKIVNLSMKSYELSPHLITVTDFFSFYDYNSLHSKITDFVCHWFFSTWRCWLSVVIMWLWFLIAFYDMRRGDPEPPTTSTLFHHSRRSRRLDVFFHTCLNLNDRFMEMEICHFLFLYLLLFIRQLPTH